jgi:acid phosphatase class B
MKIGLDYWQVVSHYPNQLGELVAALSKDGHELHIISAIGKSRIGTIALMVTALWHKFPAGNIHEVVFDDPKQSPELKLAKCQELGIGMFFDDRDDVCRLLNKHGILAMRVTRKDNSKYDLEAEQRG